VIRDRVTFVIFQILYHPEPALNTSTADDLILGLLEQPPPESGEPHCAVCSTVTLFVRGKGIIKR